MLASAGGNAGPGSGPGPRPGSPSATQARSEGGSSPRAGTRAGATTGPGRGGAQGAGAGGASPYGIAKRGFDLGLSVLLLPALGAAALLLVCLNPLFNRGPLFFRQARMGLGCRPFEAWKFRTMAEDQGPGRGAFDPLELHRITPLGGLLRRSRLDELPQVLNVLRGEMSLIGPRPDYWDHALLYLDAVPGYRERHDVLPGISGYAQTELGYAEGLDGVQAKVEADLLYVRHACLRLDLWIAWRTLAVVIGGKGS